MVLQNVLAVSSPLAGVSYYKMYYVLLGSKLFIILTKYISLERSESQDSMFCGYRCNIEREIDRFVTEMHQKKIQWGLNGTRWLFLV